MKEKKIVQINEDVIIEDEYVNEDEDLDNVYIEEKDKEMNILNEAYTEAESEIADSEFISNDIVIEDEEGYGEVETVSEQLLTFSINGLYKDKELTKIKSRGELMMKSPFMEIRSSNGDFATFPLTYQFNQMMLKSLNDVNYAYLGIKKTKRTYNDDTITSTLKKNKLLILELFIGITLGLFMSNGAAIPALITAIVGILVVFHDKLLNFFSSKEDDDINTNDENNEVEVDIDE